jgi:hypothetical protein
MISNSSAKGAVVTGAKTFVELVSLRRLWLRLIVWGLDLRVLGNGDLRFGVICTFGFVFS